MKYLIFICSILIISCTCTKKATKNKADNTITQSPTDTAIKQRQHAFKSVTQRVIKLEQVIQEPSKFVNQQIQIEGYYLAYSQKDCVMADNFSKQITRTDWIFSSAHNCVYVTGGKPSNISTSSTQTIVINAHVLQTKDNTFYLKFIAN